MSTHETLPAAHIFSLCLFCGFKIMQIRSRDLYRLKKLVLEKATLFRVSAIIFTGCVMLRPFNTPLLCLAFF